MLFDDDYEVNYGILNIPGYNLKEEDKTTNLYDDYEGFLKGNMFKDLYTPYKNYKVLPLRIDNDREKRLSKIMAIFFAINDLNLYLDLNPNDKKMFMVFKSYLEELKNEKENFEKTYGPLEVDSDLGSTYNWEENPWPWDNKGGNMYV